MKDVENTIHSAKEFVQLRTSSNPDDYQKSAHYFADESVWFDVIKHYPEMKKWVIHNKTVPMSVLELLANDDDGEVRYFLAMKNKLSRKLFEILAKDNDETVRQRLVYNKNIPLDILQQLANDEDEFIKQSAIEKLGDIEQ